MAVRCGSGDADSDGDERQNWTVAHVTASDQLGQRPYKVVAGVMYPVDTHPGGAHDVIVRLDELLRVVVGTPCVPGRATTRTTAPQ